jgi:hypothetical protein
MAQTSKRSFMQPFIATIMLNEKKDSWCIKVCDPNRDKSFTCKDLDEFEKSVQDLSAHYPDVINELVWKSDPNLPPVMLDQVRFAMLEFEKKYHDLIGK